MVDLKEKQVNLNQIKQVCIDMSPAFIAGCGEHLPNDSVTFDKFHVVEEVNKAMDAI